MARPGDAAIIAPLPTHGQRVSQSNQEKRRLPPPPKKTNPAERGRLAGGYRSQPSQPSPMRSYSGGPGTAVDGLLPIAYIQ